MPKYPQNIGIITSSGSDALHDVCSKLNSRYPIANIIIYPSLVQGKLAAKNITEQIKKCNDDNDNTTAAYFQRMEQQQRQQAKGGDNDRRKQLDSLKGNRRRRR